MPGSRVPNVAKDDRIYRGQRSSLLPRMLREGYCLHLCQMWKENYRGNFENVFFRIVVLEL